MILLNSARSLSCKHLSIFKLRDRNVKNNIEQAPLLVSVKVTKHVATRDDVLCH